MDFMSPSSRAQTSNLYPIILQAVQKDLWAAAKLVSCSGMFIALLVVWKKNKNIFIFLLELAEWITSITNMMWWSFSSSIGEKQKIN